ncbi:MAG: preprotein translocase subunit SecG [Candidatus Pacebacteria bacterium]|nr:preprotein translocase subunit SecG [Candidatus Paceibacterota bacterium]
MITLANILPVLQVITAVLLIISILPQQSEESLGGSFGGSDSVSSGKSTRRGFDKVLFQSSIVLGILFTLISIIIVVSK